MHARARPSAARLVLKLYAEASGGTASIRKKRSFYRRHAVNTASWAWQQLSVGKLATVDCWDCASAD